MTALKKVKIFGERCSGTNYLDNLMNINFDVTTIIYLFGFKHFFGHDKLLNENTKASPLICILKYYSFVLFNTRIETCDLDECVK